MNRRGFLKFAGGALLGAGLTALTGFEYMGFEVGWYKVHKMELTLPNLPAAFRGFTLTHITDLHINDWTTPERFYRVVELVNELGSDAIAITGDFIDHSTPKEMYPGVVEILDEFVAEQGVYGVLGNHDHWLDEKLVRQILEESGIVELRNQVKAFEREGKKLYLCGLDDYWERQQDLEAVTGGLPETACAILMMHEPDYADISAKTGRFALQLSGHSHGGQIDPPFMDAPVLPTYAHRYPRGLYRVGEMWQYTSTGIGVVRPRVRFNCRPEIVQFTFS